MLASLALCSLICVQSGAQDVALPVDPVVEARALLPAYEYEPTVVTTDAELAGIYAAIELLQAAVAADSTRADLRWWLAHSYVLLGEERGARGDSAGAEVRYSAALALYDEAEALQADDPWTSYARGVALRRTGRPWEAIETFDRTTALATAAAAEAGEGEARNTLLWLDMKARRFLSDARLAAFEFDAAAEQLTAWFDQPDEHAWWVDKSAWTKSFELAGLFERARDFEQVRSLMRGVLENEQYAQYASPYEVSGYIAGLLGETELAADQLQAAADHEDPPGLYPRMWVAILRESKAPGGSESEAGADAAERARASLREYLDYPPPTLSPWDRALGRFVLGDETPESFLTRVQVERRRRIAAGEPLDDLKCEAWYYAALRWDRDGDDDAAIAAYNACLSYPVPFKWEWEYARLRLNQLFEAERALPLRDFGLIDGRVAWVRPASLAWQLGLRPGAVRSVRVHSPRAPRAHEASPGVLAEPQAPGTLLMLVLDDGTRPRAVPLVVGAAAPR